MMTEAIEMPKTEAARKATLGAVLIYDHKLKSQRTPIETAYSFGTFEQAQEYRKGLLAMNKSLGREAYRNIRIVSAFHYA